MPQSIRPVFKDTSELASGVLADEICEALESSKYLIVICSPQATHSKWVDKEVQTFIDMGRSDKIIPFVIGGKPFSEKPEDECFPSALLNLPKEQELLGVNINEMGRDAAAVKVVACMFELKFDALWQRFERERRKRRNWIIVAAIIAFLCVSGVAFSMYLQNIQIQKANREMKENQIRFISERAMMLTDEGDSYTARLLALSLLPENVERQAYLPEAESALRHSSTHNSAVLKGHTNAVNDVKYSSNGKQLLSCSSDGTIKLWDAQTGQCLKTFTGHTDLVSQVDFSPDNKSIISCSRDGTMKVWSLSSGEIIKSFNVESSYAMSPNKMYIITTIHGVPGVYNAATFELIREIKDLENWRCFCWYPDDQWLSVYTENNEFQKVNIFTDQTIHVAKNEDGDELSDYIIDSQGKYMAGVFYTEETSYVRVWDVNTGHSLHTFRGNDEIINCVSFSPDGNKIVTTSMRGSIRIWDVFSGECVKILKGHPFASACPTYSPDGKCIATVSADATIRISDSPDVRESVDFIKMDQRINSISYLSNGKQLLVASDDSLYVCNSLNLEWTKTLYNQDAIRSLNYSTRGDVIGLAFKNNSVGLYDIQSQEVKILAELKGPVGVPSFSQDGKQIAFASCDSTIHVWEVATGKKLHTIPWNKGIQGFSYADNGSRMVIASDSSLSVFDIKDSVCVKSWGTPIINYASTTISPDGKYVLTSSENVIYLWEINTGKCVSELDGHVSYVYACAFSPDSKYVVSTSHETIVKVWDWRAGICVASENLGQYHAVQFSPDGRHIVVAWWGGIVRIWDFPPLQELIDQAHERFKNRQLTPEERRKYYLE